MGEVPIDMKSPRRGFSSEIYRMGIHKFRRYGDVSRLFSRMEFYSVSQKTICGAVGVIGSIDFPKYCDTSKLNRNASALAMNCDMRRYKMNCNTATLERAPAGIFSF